MSGAQLVLDVRMSRRLLRGEQLLRIVDGLRPGERMLIISADDPAPLVALICSERPFAFDVVPGEPAGAFHVQLERRLRARPRTIGECVRWEYRYFEVQLAKLSNLVTGGRWSRAVSRARALERAYARHARLERSPLFPREGEPIGGGVRRSFLVAQHRALAGLLARAVSEAQLHQEHALGLTLAQARMLFSEHERRESTLLEGQSPPQAEPDGLRAYLRARRDAGDPSGAG